MKVSTTKLKNIQDKDLYYVTISNELGTKKVNINVGEKTYNAVTELEIINELETINPMIEQPKTYTEDTKLWIETPNKTNKQTKK